jgi:hypothetical protein
VFHVAPSTDKLLVYPFIDFDMAGPGPEVAQTMTLEYIRSVPPDVTNAYRLVFANNIA